MRHFKIFILAFVLIWAYQHPFRLICSDNWALADMPTRPRNLRVINTVCYVDASNVKNKISRGIFGTNIEWINCGNGVWNKDKNKAVEDYVRLAKKEGITLVRFPGGTFSDFYHWENGTGPNNLRPTTPHFTDPGKSFNCFGTPELSRFCRAIGAQPLLTVNVGTGTPDEAASWVAYCNDENDARRKADGLESPLRVKFWELGNELYLAGTNAEKQITTPPDRYAQKVTSFGSAMKRIDPSISLIAIGVAHSYTIPFGPYYKDWNKILLKSVSDKIDYISLHNAYFPVLIGNCTASVRDVYQSLWAAPIAIDSDLQEMEYLLSHYEKGKKICIAITEWGPFFSISDPRWIDHVKTLGSAVYAGLVLQVFMKHPRVKIANYFKFTDNSFMGWISYDHQPKVPYYAVQMFSEHFGDRVVESNIKCGYYSTKQIGLVRSIEKVPELSVVSSINDSGNKLFVNIISRCWDKTYRVLFHIDGFNMETSHALVWKLSGKEAVSNNGPDIPPGFPIRYYEPNDASYSKIKITQSYYCPEKALDIPPHSIVTVEFAKKGG